MKNEPTTFNSKLTSKGQITLPAEIREALNVAPGDRVEFALHGIAEINDAHGCAATITFDYSEAAGEPPFTMMP